jgi:iron-sulfur cluster repair protein YtfE (RIC family)
MQEAAALNREHNCDICAGMNKDLAIAKAEVMLFVGQLRTSIEGIFAGISSNPAVEDIKQQISAVKAKIKLVKKEIEPIQEQIKALQEYAQEMQKLIQEIQNAPAELQALLQACLAEATGSLTSTVNDIKTIATGGIAAEVAAVVDPIKAETDAITDSVTTTTSLV